MSSPSLEKVSPLTLAAQADLVMVTVEMLRSPQSIQASGIEPWYELPFDSLEQLLGTAFGRQAFSEPLIRSDKPSQERPINSLSLHRALEEVYQLVHALDRELWSDEYYRMFDSSQACALNQASYIRRDKGTIIGDVSGFYNAFGWRCNLSRGERPDHLLSQLEFVGILFAMAAKADDAQQREVAQEALREFARIHMHDWMPTVCYHLIDTTHLAYFGAVGVWLMLLWNQLTESNAWPVDRVSDGPIAPLVDPEDPYECGAPDLVQLQVKEMGTR